MEADCQHSVSGVESFFNAVSMVYVDVNVKHSLMIAEEFEDAKDNI